MTPETMQTFAELGVPANPFPGLRPFDFEESHLFFGRDGQSEQLISKLGATHFLATVGTSGSGKSSLIRAGLIPALLGGFMTSAGSNWRIAVMRPGNDPIGNLARALNKPDVFGSEIPENAALQIALTEASLQRGSRGLVDAVRQAMMAGNQNLLVLVDQFEEIFRFARVSETKEYRDEAAAFVKLLLEAAKQREIPIYVVLTMRSDYLGDCSQFWGLPEAINESQYLIPRLTRDQLKEAITGPISVAYGNITPRLVARLLNDVGDDQDQLPVLQHLLMRMWDECKEKSLTLELVEAGKTITVPHRRVHTSEAIDLCCYDAVGGMAQALSRHADEAFNELPNDAAREIAEKLFKILTEKGTDNREIRRPVTLGEICAVLRAEESDVITVIDIFRRSGRSFLMPPADVALNSESLIDISHESLIRGWTRLKTWVDDEARSARIYLRVAQTAVLRDEGGAGLWRDPDLQIALTWREQSKPNDIWARRYHPQFASAMSFLDDSVAARDAEVQKEKARQRREINRTRLTAIVLAVGFLASMAAGSYAYSQSRKAQRAQLYAEDRARYADGQARLAEKNFQEAEIQKAFAQRNAEQAAMASLLALEQQKRAEASALQAQTNLKEATRQRTAAQVASERVVAEGLQRLAIGALKDNDEKAALKHYDELYKHYKKSNDQAGIATALVSMGDVYKFRIPFYLIFQDIDFDALDDLEPDDDDAGEGARAMKQYAEAFASSWQLQGDPEGTGKKIRETVSKAREKYRDALVANEAATRNPATTETDTRVGLTAQRGDVFQSLGDLALAEVTVEAALSGPPDADKGAKAKIKGVLKEVMQYYGQSRDFYREAEKPREEAEVLQKMGYLLNEVSKDTDDKKVGVSVEAISMYEEAGTKYGLAKKPLRQAEMLVRIADFYRELAPESSERSKAINYFERAREIYRRENKFSKEAEIEEQIAELHQADPGRQILDLKRALQVYRKAPVTESTRADLEINISKLVGKIGKLLQTTGPEATNQFFEELLANSADDRDKLKLLGSIIEFYKDQSDKSRAIGYLLQQGLIYRQTRDFLEEGDTYVRIGSLYRDSEKLPEMIKAFDVALSAYHQVEDRTKAETLTRVWGNLRNIAADYAAVDKQKAVVIYEEALDLSLGDKTAAADELIKIISSMAQILFDMKSNEANAKARQLFQKSIDGFKGREGVDVASLRATLGELYKKMGDRREARASYELALAYYRDNMFETFNHKDLLKDMAVLETEANPEKSFADFYLSEAESARKAGDQRSQGLLVELAGTFYRDSKDEPKALIYLDQARLIYKAAGLKRKEASMLTMLAGIYERTDQQKARELRKQAAALLSQP